MTQEFDIYVQCSQMVWVCEVQGDIIYTEDALMCYHLKACACFNAFQLLLIYSRLQMNIT